jgi:hypothetical protein
MEEFNAAYPASPPSRAQSQLHVRELQGQMQDLKSKISTLKVRAQVDNLRRRSLQSLRTPSPFTAAEQWYTSAAAYSDAGLKRESIVVQNPWEAQAENEASETHEQRLGNPIPSFDEQEIVNQRHSATALLPSNSHPTAEPDHEFADPNDPNGSDSSSSSEIDRDALEEILSEPLDSPEMFDQDILEEFPSVPVVTEALRHEDRVDAFDYENFYLHSVLGNYSAGIGRRDSSSSYGSVETTRPASQQDAYHFPSRAKSHKRTNSADSISTAATFATATEGAYYSDDEEYFDELDGDRTQSLSGPGTKMSFNIILRINCFANGRLSLQAGNSLSGNSIQTNGTAHHNIDRSKLGTAATRATATQMILQPTRASSLHPAHPRLGLPKTVIIAVILPTMTGRS